MRNFYNIIPRMYKFNLISVVIIFSLTFLHVSSLSYAQTGEISFLRKGTWALSALPDLFKKGIPVVGYLPPGTIIFSSKNSHYKKYIEVLTHYGQRVLISEFVEINGKLTKNLRPLDEIIKPLPTNSIILHEDILCIGQTNRIAVGQENCKNFSDPEKTIPKVGKGWIYTFDTGEKENWVNLKAELDKETTNYLIKNKLDPKEADFEIRKEELESLEKQGFLTMLDKPLPRLTFDYDLNSSFVIPCGEKKITKKKIGGTITTTVESGGEFSFWKWAYAKVGITAEAMGSVEKEVELGIDTTNSSYLFYSATMNDAKTNKKTTINIEKEFECVAKRNNKTGHNILQVNFELLPEDSVEPEILPFSNPKDLINTPTKTKERFPRPVFISINTPEQQMNVIRNIMKEGVDVYLANFILTNLNNTCSSARREECAKDAMSLE
jgi:hypothetical protein